MFSRLERIRFLNSSVNSEGSSREEVEATRTGERGSRFTSPPYLFMRQQTSRAYATVPVQKMRGFSLHAFSALPVCFFRRFLRPVRRGRAPCIPAGFMTPAGALRWDPILRILLSPERSRHRLQHTCQSVGHRRWLRSQGNQTRELSLCNELPIRSLSHDLGRVK